MRIIVFCCLFLFCSCKTVIKTYNNVNQNKKFGTIETYKVATVKETGFAKDKIIVLSDVEFLALSQDIVKDHQSTFYGIVYNTELISANELNIKSCQGQITNLYHKISQEGTNFQKHDISKIKALKFEAHKKTVIMLYSYKLGKLANTQVKPVIRELEDDPNFDYYIISLDNFDILEK